MHACRVVAWEPVPQFRAFTEYAVALNGLSHLVDLRATAAADQAGVQYNMTIPQRGWVRHMQLQPLSFTPDPVSIAVLAS